MAGAWSHRLRSDAHRVSERLGHAKTSITLDTYAHNLSGMQDRAVEAIDNALSRTG